MRITLATVLALGLLVVAAAHGALAPRSLVLTTRDVPRGFVLDRDDTGVETNDELAAQSAEDLRRLRRMGRVTGYTASWDQDRRQASLVSRVDVFRRSSGARSMLDLYVRELDRSGIKGLGRRSAPLGGGGWIWAGGQESEVAFVAWRHGRVFAYVAAWGLTGDRVLSLARAQGRRIAAALG